MCRAIFLSKVKFLRLTLIENALKLLQCLMVSSFFLVCGGGGRVGCSWGLERINNNVNFIYDKQRVLKRVWVIQSGG